MSVCDFFFFLRMGTWYSGKLSLDSARLIPAPILAFKHLRGHPSCTSLVVGHVSLDITCCTKVTYLQHSPACHEEETTQQRSKSHYRFATLNQKYTFKG